MKKQCIAACAVLLLAGSLFAGGRKDAGTPGNTTVPRFVGKQDPYAKYDPPISLTSARTMSPNDQFDQNDSDKRSFVENRWNRVFKEDLGVNISYDWISPDSQSNVAKWNAAIAADIVPDFALVNDNIYAQLLDAELVADMSEIWNAYADEEYLGSLAPTDVGMMTVDGKMRGFPGGTRAMAGTTLLFIRQDWLDQLKLPLPQTFDDVANIAKAFKDAGLAGSDTIGLLLSNNVSGGNSFAGGDGKWDGILNGYGAYLDYWIEKDGKLAYSTVQPEARLALLKIQELVRSGTINRDFATVTEVLAREYIASGKTGVFYSSAWCTTLGMNSLAKTVPGMLTEPHKLITPLFPPPARAGQQVKVQTNSPKGMRIFVSSRSKNPEAPLKMAMLAYHYRGSPRNGDRWYYFSDEAGFPFYKYLPWGDSMTPVDEDLYRAYAVKVAAETGDMTIINERNWTASWDQYQMALKGESQPYQMMMNGPHGSFTVVYDAYNKGNVLLQGFNGLPTATMALKGDILRSALEAALFDVAMGANISVWDNAVQKWFSDGGTQITGEVNTWYEGTKK
jgi:putative aldouronate transport system substrate-binding protein